MAPAGTVSGCSYARQLLALQLHERGKVALMFSGGKDSRALVEQFRPYIDGITVYHLDTGDMFPEMERMWPRSQEPSQSEAITNWRNAGLGLITKGTINNGLASKQAADAQAEALASTIRELQAKGLVSLSAIARELNAQQIPSAQGGKWHPSTVSRLLHRLRPSRRLRSSSRHRD